MNIRWYLIEKNDDLFRLPYTSFAEKTPGKAYPQFANSRQRIIQAMLGDDGMMQLAGTYVEFDARGHYNHKKAQLEAGRAYASVIGAIMAKGGPVVELAPIREERQRHDRDYWEPGQGHWGNIALNLLPADDPDYLKIPMVPEGR